jgi:pantothenate kinase-related protein Tda10
MPEIVDDKSQYCIPFILERLKAHQEKHAGGPNAPPFFLGMNGVQGAGKTVLVCILPAWELLRQWPIEIRLRLMGRIAGVNHPEHSPRTST